MKIKLFFPILLLVFFSLVSASCGRETKIEPQLQKVPPVRLTLKQAFSVQKSLFVKANVEILANIPAEDVIVGAIGLKEGTVKEEQFTPLSKVVNKKILHKGSSLNVPFELPMSDITEFQLQCSWGNDAKKIHVDGDLNPPEPKKPSFNPTIIAEAEEEMLLRGLPQKGIVIDSINIEEQKEACPSEPCTKKVKIKAIVKNLSRGSITNLSLAFGLFWTSEGKIPKLPKDLDSKLPNEEELTFGEINLPVGGTIPFSVNIGRSAMEVPGGEFRPHVRILSYK